MESTYRTFACCPCRYQKNELITSSYNHPGLNVVLLTLLSKTCVPLGKIGSNGFTASKDTVCGPFLRSVAVSDEPSLIIGVKFAQLEERLVVWVSLSLENGDVFSMSFSDKSV